MYERSFRNEHGNLIAVKVKVIQNGIKPDDVEIFMEGPHTIHELLITPMEASFILKGLFQCLS